MRRAVRLGLFIGTIIGMSACASAPAPDGRPTSGAYGGLEVGRTG